MSRTGKKWLVAWLFLAWLAWELVAAFDDSADTWPLTHLVIKYLPVWIYFPAVLIFAAWLIWHFWPDRHSGRHNNPLNPREGTMSRVVTSGPHARRDAANRAIRTFIQGMWVTVVGAAATALTAAMSGGIRWTKEYWYGVSLAVAGSVAMAITAYIYRLAVPPPAPVVVSRGSDLP